jgi:hypothetical protein
VPPCILDIPTTSNYSHDKDQPTHEVSDDVLNDDQEIKLMVKTWTKMIKMIK